MSDLSRRMRELAKECDGEIGCEWVESRLIGLADEVERIEPAIELLRRLTEKHLTPRDPWFGRECVHCGNDPMCEPKHKPDCPWVAAKAFLDSLERCRWPKNSAGGISATASATGSSLAS